MLVLYSGLGEQQWGQLKQVIQGEREKVPAERLRFRLALPEAELQATHCAWEKAGRVLCVLSGECCLTNNKRWPWREGCGLIQGLMRDQMPNGLKLSLPLAGACQSRPAAPSGHPWFSYCSGGGREQEGGAQPSSSSRLSSNGQKERLEEHLPPDSAAGCLGPLLASPAPPTSPPCHLPLQSISGSCMWVTQQHCSQAEEAAAELKVSGRSSERCTLLPLGSLDCPALCTLGDFRIFN